MSKFDVWVLMAYYDQPLDDADFSTFFTVTSGGKEPRAKVTTYDAGISGISNPSDEILISIRLM